MAYLVSRAELARQAGCSAMAVTKRCRLDLAPACVGKRVDLEHPVVVAWLKSRDRAAPSAPEPAKTAPAMPTTIPRYQRPPPEDDDEQQLSVDLTWTLGELVERFGSKEDRGSSCPAALKDWLSCAKLVVDIRDKSLKNDETAGALVSREFVKTHVFGAIESAFKRLVTDSPKVIARRIHAASKADQSVEDSEATVRELISSQLIPMKQKVIKAIRDAGEQ